MPRTAVAGWGRAGTSAAANTAFLRGGAYWHRAELVVIGMMAVVAVRIHEFFPGISVVKPVFTLSVLGIFLLYRHSAESVRRNLIRHRLSVLVYMYFGAVCATIPVALWRGGAIEVARALFPAVLLYAAFQLTTPRRATLDRLQFAFVILVLFFSWYLQTFGRLWRGRLVSVSGTFNENDVASLLAMTLPMAIAMLMRVQGTKKKIGAGVAILSIVSVVVATGSRGGALALAAGAVVFVLGLNSVKATLVMYFMAMGAGVAWFTAPPVFKNRMRSLQNLENDYNLTAETGRKAVWRRGRQYFLEHPILGVGAGNFFVAEGNYNQAIGRTGKWSSAHNAYVQAFAELGFVGGSIFLILLLTAAHLAYTFWRRANWSRGPPFHRPELLAALAAYSVGAVFLSHAYFSPLFALLGLIALAARIREAEAMGGVTGAPVNEQTGVAQPVGERGGIGAYPAAATFGPSRGAKGMLRGRGGLSAQTR